MRKVLHIITQMEAGGAQGAAVRNSIKFREKGYISSVVFLYTKRPVYKDEEDVISLFPEQPKNPLHLIIIIKRLFCLILSERPYAIVSYTHYANVICGIVGRFCGVKKIVASHRNPVDTYPTICRHIDKLIGRLGFYSKAITVSKTVLDSFKHYPTAYKNKLTLVLNGIPQIPKEDNKNSRFRKSNDKFKFVSTGRLHHQKNQETIILAMRDIQNSELHIAGDGELKEHFNQLITKEGLSDKVFLIGEIKPNEVASFLLSGDCFLFPSKYEAFGFSVVEAMSAGLPIICSDIPAMQEIVSDSGIRIDTFDVDAWAESIKKITSRPELKSDLSIRSLERSKLYSLDTMAEGYIKAIENA